MPYTDEEVKQAMRLELAERIHQFLRFESESNSQNLPESSRESLTVAAECVEQAFGLTKPQSERPPSDDLLKIYIEYARANDDKKKTTTNEQSTPKERKMRKNASNEDKQKAEEYKNKGNELMKQNEHKQACEFYTRAIELDDNNAVYYSNRAAAYSKMGNHQLALKDCEEAIEIDPNYSKAYGRMGLAYACMQQHDKAKEAYSKALELDPTNQSNRNNLNIAEENLRNMANEGGSSSTGLGSGTGPRIDANSINAMLSDPNAIANIMRRIQDPAVSNIIGNVMSAAMTSNLFGGAGVSSNQQSTPSTDTTGSGQQTSTANTAGQGLQQEPPQAHPQPQFQPQPQPQPQSQPQPQPQTQMPPNPAAGLTQLLAAGQQIASALQSTNPQLMSQIEQMFQRPPNSDSNNEGTPPPGYS